MTTLTSPPDARRRASYGIAIVLVAQLMLVLDVTVVNVALPRIQTDLDFSPAGLSWVLNAYTLAFGGLLLLGGRLGDVFGRLRVFVLGLSLFTAASLAGGLAPTPEMLVDGTRPARRRRRRRRTQRAGAPHHLDPRRGVAQPRARPVHRGLVSRRLDRPDPGRRAHRPRLVALDPRDQRADRHRGHRPRPPLRRRDGAPSRPVRRGGRGHGDTRLGRRGLRFINAPDHGWDSIGTIGGFALAAALLVIFVRTERVAPHPLLRLGLLRNRRRAQVP